MDNIIIYNTDDGKTRVQLYAKDGTVWMSQAEIAELFQKSVSTISRHICNIFHDKELDKERNLQKMQFPNSDKRVAMYSLSMILAVGFCVHSSRGTQFMARLRAKSKHQNKGFLVLANNEASKSTFFDVCQQRSVKKSRFLTLANNEATKKHDF